MPWVPISRADPQVPAPVSGTDKFRFYRISNTLLALGTFLCGVFLSGASSDAPFRRSPIVISETTLLGISHFQ